MRKRESLIACAVIYGAMAIFTFGNAGANSTCATAPAADRPACYTLVRPGFAAVMGALWPLYWSWKLQERD